MIHCSLLFFPRASIVLTCNPDTRRAQQCDCTSTSTLYGTCCLLQHSILLRPEFSGARRTSRGYRLHYYFLQDHHRRRGLSVIRASDRIIIIRQASESLSCLGYRPDVKSTECCCHGAVSRRRCAKQQRCCSLRRTSRPDSRSGSQTCFRGYVVADFLNLCLSL